MVEHNEHDCRGSAEVRRATLQSPYHFVDCGLPNVYLAGIRYRVCQECGKRSAEIPAVGQLMAVIARAVVEKDAPLSGAEIRFLRKRLGKKATDFARIVGVTPEQVSRWENSSNPPEKSADKFIRLYYCLQSHDAKMSDLLRKLENVPGPEHSENIQATLNRQGRQWRAEAEPVAA